MTDTTPLPFVDVLDHGIHVIDTGFHRPRFDASYLIVEDGRAAFVDTGTNYSVPRLLAALDATGLARDAVDYVIATHVHLDHAGGVGLLMQSLPRAQLVVHPRGAPHLIDPSALVYGASAVYGADEVARTYGQVVGVPEGRVMRSEDGMTIGLAGRLLTFLDTPGHARHHHCIWDERSRGFFTGDTFGLSYREFDSAQGAWLLPTTTPVQFEPDALRTSVRRLIAFDPARMYLTHYGAVGDVARLGAELLEQLAQMVQLGETLRAHPDRHAALKQGLAAMYTQRVAQHGCTMGTEAALELLAMDMELNAQGMAIWLNRQKR